MQTDRSQQCCCQTAKWPFDQWIWINHNILAEDWGVFETYWKIFEPPFIINMYEYIKIINILVEVSINGKIYWTMFFQGKVHIEVSLDWFCYFYWSCLQSNVNFLTSWQQLKCSCKVVSESKSELLFKCSYLMFIT